MKEHQLLISAQQFQAKASEPMIGHENAHAQMLAFLAIISANSTKLLQL